MDIAVTTYRLPLQTMVHTTNKEDGQTPSLDPMCALLITILASAKNFLLYPES